MVECKIADGAIERGTIQEGRVLKDAKQDRGG